MFLTLLETDNKQILRHCAPQNDIATRPQGDGRQAYNPNFRRRARRSQRLSWRARRAVPLHFSPFASLVANAFLPSVSSVVEECDVSRGRSASGGNRPRPYFVNFVLFGLISPSSFSLPSWGR